MKILGYELQELKTRPASNSYVLYAIAETTRHVVAEFVNKTPSKETVDFAVHCWKKGVLAAGSILGYVELNAPVNTSVIPTVNSMSFRTPVPHNNPTNTVRRGPVTNGPSKKSVKTEEPESGIKFRKSKF